MRHLERRIADFSCLLTEDRAEQSLFSRELCFALRRYLADENVTGTNLCTDADDAALVEVLKSIVADTRNICGDLLRSELRVSGFALILFDMYRCIYVVLYHLL